MLHGRLASGFVVHGHPANLKFAQFGLKPFYLENSVRIIHVVFQVFFPFLLSNVISKCVYLKKSFFFETCRGEDLVDSYSETNRFEFLS